MNHRFPSLLFIFFLAFGITSCKEMDNPLEQALTFAGPNRPELEKVLQYYSQNPSDSLKYRAACFLIKNMPHYYSFQDSQYADFKERVIRFANENDYPVLYDYQRMIYAHDFSEKYGQLWRPGQVKIYDSHIITSDYIIDNIERSFQVWKEKPWGKKINFEDFCEEILPYRIEDEPFENWEKLYYESYQPVLDSLLKSDDPVEAGSLIYSRIYNQRWIFDTSVPITHLGAEALFQSRLGDCGLIANYAVYVFRALGIPSGCMYLLHDHTRGKEERIFTYEDGKQVWW